MITSVRTLRRHPAFASLVIATIAVAIGLTSALYAAVDAIMIRGLPYPASDRLMSIWEPHPTITRAGPSYPDYIDWVREVGAFQDIAAYTDEGLNRLTLSDGAEPQEVDASLVSENLLRTLGVSMRAGRGFAPPDFTPGQDNVAMLSERFWSSRYDSDPRAIGRTIDLDGSPVRIIGVVPRDQQLPAWADVMLPLSRLPQPQQTSRRPHPLVAIGRLKPGATRAAAESELKTVMARLAREFPKTNGPFSAAVTPLQDDLLGKLRTPLLLLLGASAAVLLIACVNVAALITGRLNNRLTELAVRQAMGASALRVASEVAREHTVVFGLAAVLGVGIAAATAALMRASAAALVPELRLVTLNPAVVVASVAMTMATMIVCAFVPAYLVGRTGINVVLRASERGATDRSTRRACRLLITAELALSVTVLGVAVMLSQSLTKLVQQDPGFTPDRLLTFRVALSPAKYRDQAHVDLFWSGLTDELRALPGVADVGVTSVLPLTSTLYETRFTIEPGVVRDPNQPPAAQFRVITPDYVSAAGMRLLRGRLLNWADTLPKETLCLVNETFVRKYLPGTTGLQQRFYIGMAGAPQSPALIVGVLRDVRDLQLASGARPEMYLLGNSSSAGVVVRVRGDPSTLVASVRDVVHSIDPAMAVSSIQPMRQLMATTVDAQRFVSAVSGGFAIVALFLAGVGLFGVLGLYIVAERRTIAIRMALGGTPRAIALLVVREAIRPVGVGLLLGACGVVAAGTAVRSMLFDVARIDVPTLIIVTAVLAIVAAIATAVPLIRALRVPAALAMRS